VEQAPGPGDDYRRRVVDLDLDQLLTGLPAVSLDGAKGVGKTSTARRRAATVIALDQPGVLEVIAAQPDRIIAGSPPVLIDEWQRFPAAWDLVRRAVDADPRPGHFLLTGSATPSGGPTHSGAGRIVPIRMRPFTVAERGLEEPTVSLRALLLGDRTPVDGSTGVTLTEYVHEIVTGGFPGMRYQSPRVQRAALDGYLSQLLDHDVNQAGLAVRRPETLRRWLTGYAAATATTTSWDRIRDASTPGEDAKPAKTTTIPYREVLERLWVLDDVPAWAPPGGTFAPLVSAAKHHLADPALAARLLGTTPEALLRDGGTGSLARDGTLLGALFESLAVLSVRVYAQAAEARVGHLRTRGGEREIDVIVERADHGIVAIEVKLSATVDDHDVRHLRWLGERMGDHLVDAVVITTGSTAYRRRDGIAVVPLALLGP
jgi:uncharacterized protein